MTHQTIKVYRLTAEEDIAYRVGNSYPRDGFFIAQGDSITINTDGLKLLKVRKWGTKQLGKYKLEAL